MNTISIHDVKAIELVSAFPANSNSRTIRITANQYGAEVALELTVYGDTDALDLLPRAAGFQTYPRTSDLSHQQAKEAV